MATRRNTQQQYRQPINWTVIITVSLAIVIVSLLGPLSWRFTAQANDAEMKLGLVWVMVLLTLTIIIGGLVLVMNAFSRMTLRHVEQDDRDEAQKAAQQFNQLAKMMLAMQQLQQPGGQQLDLAQLFAQVVGNGGTGFRDVTTGGDIKME